MSSTTHKIIVIIPLSSDQHEGTTQYDPPPPAPAASPVDARALLAAPSHMVRHSAAKFGALLGASSTRGRESKVRSTGA